MNRMTLAGMLPGTPVRSVDELNSLPAHSVVLRRSTTQPHFRTAWTLTVLDPGNRYWSSSSWLVRHSDEDMLAGAAETMILLYRPVESFAIGLLDGHGSIEMAAPMEAFETLGGAARALPRRAGENPMSTIIHRIDPGSWVVYEGALPS